MNEKSDITYYDRYQESLRSEKIYGEKWLRWAYETALGSCLRELVVKRLWFSRCYGRWADSPRSRKEIAPFLEKYDVNPAEFAEKPDSFATFNEFFFRKLTREARPIAPENDLAVFPADGRHLLVPDVDESDWIYTKGQRLSLEDLLGDPSLAGEFAGGTAVLSRLCPTDYHRFHFPLGGVTGPSTLLNGYLYSVNPLALLRRLSYLWENKRQVTIVSDSPVGRYAFIEVGATNVGGIVLTSAPGETVAKGDEKGYFRFGGSMVISLFAKNRFEPAEDLVKQSGEGRELYARMGDKMGRVLA